MCLELMAHRSFRVADKETPLSYTDDCTETGAFVGLRLGGNCMTYASSTAPRMIRKTATAWTEAAQLLSAQAMLLDVIPGV
jgi:hypothetical protein